VRWQLRTSRRTGVKHEAQLQKILQANNADERFAH
jgi:hypothetical protein